MTNGNTFENGYIASEEFPEYIEHFFIFPEALMLRWQPNNSACEASRPRLSLVLMIETGWY
jgi:hypothetical protein